MCAACRAQPGLHRRVKRRLALRTGLAAVAGRQWFVPGQTDTLVRLGRCWRLAGSSPPPHDPPESAESARAHYEDQQSERDQDAVSEADVCVGGFAHGHLVAKITSALAFGHLCYSSAAEVVVCYDVYYQWRSSAKNGACLCLGLENFGRGRRSFFWIT